MGTLLAFVGLIAWILAIIALIKPKWAFATGRMTGFLFWFFGGAVVAMTGASIDGAFDKPVDQITAEALPSPTPAEAKQAEAKPAEAKPAEAKPAEAKPAEAKPAEAKPAEAKQAVYKTTATKLYDDYEANEVATDEKIGDKQIEITGTVDGVDKDFIGNISIKLKTSNMFLPASMTLQDAEKEKAIKTSKGSKVTLVCNSMSRSMGMPIGSSCLFK